MMKDCGIVGSWDIRNFERKVGLGEDQGWRKGKRYMRGTREEGER